MDDAARRVDPARVGLLLRVRRRREEAATRAVHAATAALAEARAEAEGAGRAVLDHDAARRAHERAGLDALAAGAVPARDLERHRRTQERLAERAAELAERRAEADAAAARAEQERDRTRVRLAACARDAAKWDGIRERVATARRVHAETAADAEAEDETSDRHAAAAAGPGA